MSLFPNPVNELLQVSVESKEKIILMVNIFNTNGQSMMEKNIAVSYKWNDKIDVKNFPFGLYYLQIKSKEGESQILKFFKN